MRNLANSAAYQKTRAYTEQDRLPVGGYVIRIEGVEYQENRWGNVIVLHFDITEGEYREFFAKNYMNQPDENKKWKGTFRLNEPKDDGSEQDEWTMRKFKTAIEAFEDSNPGFHFDWNEQSLKGKMVGAVFGEDEYNGNKFTKCGALVPMENIRGGKYRIPTFKKKSGKGQVGDGFIEVPAGSGDEGLPFD